MAFDPAVARYLPLKTHWFHVLAALAEQDQHGYGIMQNILERTDGKVKLWPPTLYGTLRNLLAEGLVEESRRRPPGERDDPRRKYYTLTSLGRGVINAECERLQELIRSIQPTRVLRERKA
jgi:DNA-binding PadR family transcriptional regulator